MMRKRQPQFADSSGASYRLLRFQAYDHIEPGGSGLAYLSTLFADGTTFQTSGGTVTVYDSWDDAEVGDPTNPASAISYGVNHFIPGEYGICTLDHAAKQWMIVGEHGLYRECKPDGAITDGSSGTVSIWASGADTTYNVTAYNTWGVGDVASGDKCFVKWFPEAGRWILISRASVYKPYIRFTLTAALTTADSSGTGTITTQYGPGIASPNTGAGAITLYNYLTSVGATYRWEGDAGTAGIAAWDSGANYLIIDMECP